MKIILYLLIVVTSLVLGTSLDEGFSELENTYTNEKCGISIQYPKDWTVKESNYIYEDKSKTIADFQSADNDIYGLDIEIENFALSKYSMSDIAEEKGFEEPVLPGSKIIYSGIGEINGFPTYKLIYSDAIKFYRSHILIIAFDREYQLNFDESDKEDFDKYSSIVEEMANSIKITKPNFEGVKC